MRQTVNHIRPSFQRFDMKSALRRLNSQAKAAHATIATFIATVCGMMVA